MFSAADVLRGPGGQFAGSRPRGGAQPTGGAGGGKAGGTKTAGTKAGGAHGTHNARGHGGGGGVMFYDPRTNRGTGYGQRHGDKRVRQLQQALNALGLRDGRGRTLAVDGKLGPLTTHALMNAQRALHLKPDGRVTPQLLAQIAAMAKAKHPPKRSARSMMRHGQHRHRAPRKHSAPAPGVTRDNASATRTRGD